MIKIQIQEAYIPTDLQKEDAEKKWQEYCRLIHREPLEQYKILKRAYYELKQGRTIIDIYKAFEVAGTFENGYPRLAIARAGQQKVVFRGSNWRRSSGGFYKSPDAIVAQTLIPTLKRDYLSERETLVPIVPSEHCPENGLNKYFILWEVEEDGWKPTPTPPGDPLLLKRISKNLFAVMAAWDLTPLERAAIKSALL